ncbi:MAG: glycosyl hydrolase [Bacteroidota bacterium]
MKFTFISLTFCLSLILSSLQSQGQVVSLGDGSYTLNFPGVDAAGRNGFPSGTPYTTGIASNKPVPTNDWWSHKVKNSHSANLFNYPFTLKTTNKGLVVSYIPWGVIDDIEPIRVGVSALQASAAYVSDFSDWALSMDWSSGNQHFQATTGIGMPFLYFEKDASDVAEVEIREGNVTILNEVLLIENARNGADFAVYAPSGSVWMQNGNMYTSTLNGENYWSLAFLPQQGANLQILANTYKKYAYVFPTDTKVSWDYDEPNALMTTNFRIETEVKEGIDSSMLIGLLPHQWNNLASGSPSFTSYTYTTVRGELKMMESNSFQVANTFHGILPTLPYLDFYSSSFSPTELNSKIKLLENDQLNSWTDSYNEGQEMNRLIQTARIAELSGDTEALQKLIETVKERLEDWLEVNANEVAFLFYYNQTWSALLGYPAGHGQDANINDHHFHWGYFIHAASFMEQYEPGWAAKWGEMINLLVRDAASSDREDPMFPFLRNFSPYGGHCWANGFASFPQGNDQESTSESMQFNSSLIHWGEITGNDSIRDLGIYLYTTEQTAIEEYWFDQYERNFSPNHPYSLVSRVWGNSYDNGTFWTNDIAASYGIELYPIHGGSLYLGQDTNYVRKLWTEIEQNTGILNNVPNVNLWHDIMWEYLAFIDPEKAIRLYNSYPDRSLKFGVSDAQTYHWLHAMNVLGNVNVSLTADHPLAAAFNKDGNVIYVGQNYGSDSLLISFSDGYSLKVAPRSMATSLDISIKGELSSSFAAAYPGGSVELSLEVLAGTATKVEFYDGAVLLGEISQAPFVFTADDLGLGKHQMFARVYEGDFFNISNSVSVIVGEQKAYGGTDIPIAGIFDAAHYDVFEGGLGDGIAYQDANRENEGNFRLDEYVDAESHVSEGDVLGWISEGEWVEYTVEVQEAGNYDLSFRYACGNNAGGGPFRIESDGQIVKDGINVAYTGDWNNWRSQTVNAIPLKSGKQVLRLYFERGELNLGRLNFAYISPLNYSQAVADAGPNQIVVLPQNRATLDAGASFDPDGNPLSYQWTQIYGPSVLSFDNPQAAQTQVDALVEGVYLLKLKVDNGSYSDEDEVFLISSLSNNVPPTVSILSPEDNASFIEGDVINISVVASDLNDSIQSVKFYVDGAEIGSDDTFPYEYDWTSGPGMYRLSAVAFDHFNASDTSQQIAIEIKEAPSCEGTSWNGDFDYVFSEDDQNPTITFIPSRAGVGSPTCILYYGTDPNSLPGYGVSPNVPYRINADEGSLIYFYYTYSYPGAVERNSAANQNTYVVGSCRTVSAPEFEELELTYYPNPVTNRLTVELPIGENEIKLYDLSGRLLDDIKVRGNDYSFDMEVYPKGIYFLRVKNANKRGILKVVK